MGLLRAQDTAKDAAPLLSTLGLAIEDLAAQGIQQRTKHIILLRTAMETGRVREFGFPALGARTRTE